MQNYVMLCNISKQFEVTAIYFMPFLLMGNFCGENGFTKAICDFLWLRPEHNSLDIAKHDFDCPGSLSPAEWAQVVNNELCLEIPTVSSS